MTQFTTDGVFDALKATLNVVENAERRKQLENFIDAARLSLERSVFDLLSRFADDVNGQVSAHYDVRLSYRPGVLELDVRPREPGEPAGEAWSMAEGEVEKITLRIPAELKELATEAAAKAGLSVNTWFVRVLARAVRGSETPEPPPTSRRWGHESHRTHGRSGQRLTGWAGPEE